MDKFTILALSGSARDIPYLIKELRQKNLIAATEKDVGGDTIYLTNNLFAVKKIVSEFDGLILDVVKNK
jgi:hypothetical protein